MKNDKSSLNCINPTHTHPHTHTPTHTHPHTHTHTHTHTHPHTHTYVQFLSYRCKKLLHVDFMHLLLSCVCFYPVRRNIILGLTAIFNETEQRETSIPAIDFVAAGHPPEKSSASGLLMLSYQISSSQNLTNIRRTKLLVTYFHQRYSRSCWLLSHRQITPDMD